MLSVDGCDTVVIGTPDRIRTRNLRGRNPLLYPVELRGRPKATRAVPHPSALMVR